MTGRQLRLSAYQGAERHEVLLEPTLISEHFPFLRQGILAGLGVGLVPDYVVQDKLATGEVLTTLDEYRLSIFGTHMYLLYLPNRHQTRAVRTCIDFLLDKAQHAEGGVPAESAEEGDGTAPSPATIAAAVRTPLAALEKAPQRKTPAMSPRRRFRLASFLPAAVTGLPCGGISPARSAARRCAPRSADGC